MPTLWGDRAEGSLLCRPSASLGSVIAVICVGLLLLVYGEAEFNMAGFIIVMTASALSGLRWTITQVLLQGSTAHGVGDALNTLALTSRPLFKGVQGLVFHVPCLCKHVTMHYCYLWASTMRNVAPDDCHFSNKTGVGLSVSLASIRHRRIIGRACGGFVVTDARWATTGALSHSCIMRAAWAWAMCGVCLSARGLCVP